MRKYIFIFKTTFLESLQYTLNIILGFVSFFVVLFVFLNLWQYIYADSTNLISGYSMEQMIWYVIITEIIFFGTRNRTLTGQMTSDIKSGTIAYNMNKPYNYIYYIVSRHLGEITLRFFLYLGIGILIGYHFVGGLAGFQAVNLILIVPVFLLGTLINSFLRMCISILSFWMEDAGPYHWIYDKIIIVVGTLFPVEMFPDWAQPLIKFSPIYVVTYGPAKLVIDFSMEMLWRVLLAQGIYLGITIIIITVMYQKGVKKLNVNGG